MESDDFTPLVCLWGKVEDVREVPNRKGCVQVTVAGQKLTLERTTDQELEKLGLLRLSKKKNRVFLVVFKHMIARRHVILAGWKNPPDLLVRRIQPLVLANGDSLYREIAMSCPRPDWQDFDYDEFVEVELGSES